MKKVQVLGPGCPRCQEVAANVETAAKAAGLEVQVEKVSDSMDIAKFGVMFTPALAVDGDVKVSGRVPDIDEIKAWLTD